MRRDFQTDEENTVLPRRIFSLCLILLLIVLFGHGTTTTVAPRQEFGNRAQKGKHVSGQSAQKGIVDMIDFDQVQFVATVAVIAF